MTWGMGRIIALAAAALLAAAPLCRAGTDIYGIDIDVALRRDGTALVKETWDVKVSGITEWYLVRENLGDIEISGLKVREGDRDFLDEGAWDVDRSIRRKTFRCGIVEKYDGCEICWGVGSDGRHVFTVSYEMSNAVKSLQDYDMLHLQLVSPGLSSLPEQVRASVSAPVQLDTAVARIWGFGYHGTSGFENGKAVFEAAEGLEDGGSLIVLLRFDKGIFESGSVQDRPFEEALGTALEGASFSERSFWDKLYDFFLAICAILTLFLIPVLAVVKTLSGGGDGKPGKHRIRKFLGKKPSDILWCRSIPFGADLLKCNYIAQNAGLNGGKRTLSASLILKLLQDGYLTVRKDADGKIEIMFSESADTSRLSPGAAKLLSMMREASGEDKVLQDKEFSRWAKKHGSRVSRWAKESMKEGKTGLEKSGDLDGKKLTAAGKENAWQLVGFKKYLQDYTLLKERHTEEVVLWRDYLCLAALFGIAKEVAKELKNINPEAFEQSIGYDYGTMDTILYTTSRLSLAITNTLDARSLSGSGGSTGSFGGFGGSSSFGGGGGFSGGGFGGGGR